MEISKLTIGVAAATCVTVGASGAYLLTRGSGPTAGPTQGVEQSEVVLADTSAGLADPPSEVAPPAPNEPAPRHNSSPAPAPRASQPAAKQVAPQAPPRPAAQTPIVAEQAAAQAHPPEPVTTDQFVEASSVASAEPTGPLFEDLVIAADSVLGLQMETSVTSETAQVEDTVVARVVRDVRVGDRVAIPAGAKAHGEVTFVDRGGKVRDKAQLGVRFTSVVLADGVRVPIETDTVFREGDGPGGASAAKIGGGAIGGAILGGIFGGAKGAILGGSAGAGAGTAAVLAGSRNPATLPAGTPVTVRLVRPATVTIDVP